MNVKFSLPLIAIALALAGCPNREAQREAKIQQSMLQDQVARVTFVTPTIENVNETMEISGAFEALNQVQLGAKLREESPESPSRTARPLGQVKSSRRLTHPLFKSRFAKRKPRLMQLFPQKPKRKPKPA